jgi:3D (Asp-Asp-Asp) domain-containing protein
MHQEGDAARAHKLGNFGEGVVRCRPVRWRSGTLPVCLLALLAAAGLALTAAAAGGADSAPTLRSRETALRTHGSSLASRSHAALLELYSVETRLGAARARLASLERRASALARERQQAARDLGVARTSVVISHRRLAARLRVLYEQGEVDPVAVVLGASSLDEAIAGIDNLNRAALLDQSVLEQTLRARTHLRALSRQLAARSAAVEAARRAAAATATELAATRAERVAYIARLGAEERLNGRRIASLDRAAQAAEARSAAVVTITPTAAALQDAPAQASGRTLAVLATGYSLSGSTASGIPVGWGVVAVDPSVIPLGTRMTIPGYGDGVAADVGGAVQGAAIDLWFPTRAQARAWGRRPVTIMLH